MQPAPPLDPIERYGPLAAKLLLYLILSIYFLQAVDVFSEVRPYAAAPFLFAAIRNGIFLFLHEGGHFIMFPFGRTLSILGGSFWQIMFPFLSFLIGLRQRSHVVAPLMLFFTATNMMDVSLYMRDAPLRRLRLLGGDKAGHDWWNLFRQWDMLDSAETVADIMYVTGLLVSVLSLGAGIFLAFYRSKNPLPYRIKYYDEDAQRERVTPMVRKQQDPPPLNDPFSPKQEEDPFKPQP